MDSNSIINQKYSLHISKQIIISFLGKNNNNKIYNNSNINSNIIIIKSDFNKNSKIIKNINLSFNNTNNITSDKNNKEMIYRNNYPNNINNLIIGNSNNKIEINKNNLSSNYFSPINKKTVKMNILEENKEENTINNKIRKKNGNYKERIEKLIGDMNRPSVNAVISLDIPSDIPYEITPTQKQFNMLRAQLRRRKMNRQKKMKGDENYQRYYELYKNRSNKIYNGTFNYNNRRLKHFEETRGFDEDNNDKDIYLQNFYKTNDILSHNIKNNNINFFLTFRNDKNLSNKNYNTCNCNQIKDYNSRNNKINFLFDEKKRSSSERSSFIDKLNKKVPRNKSTIVYPSNY